jgi:hypothetical protein
MMRCEVKTAMQADARRTATTAVACFFVAAVAMAFAGCGTKNLDGSGFDDGAVSGSSSGSTSDDGSNGDDGSTASSSGGSSGGFGPFVLPDGDMPDRGAPPANCKLPGLWCYQTTAPCVTKMTGTVYDPAAQVPLSNVVVYVPADPSKPLTPIKTGTNSCSACTTTIENYMALAVTDVNGNFTMTGVPATSGVPVVVQIGKWRREITLAQDIKACSTYSVPDKLLRLPQSQQEGDIPQMAVVTGGADDLGCFLRGMGLAASEYSAPKGGGRLDIYQGVGGPGLATGTAGVCNSATTVCPLYASMPALEYYDIVLLACEGGENGQTKPAASLQFMHDWLGEGGKVFATHFQYYWFKNGPTDFQNVATWTGFSAGAGVGNYVIDTSFNRGMAFDQWLTGPSVGAATGTQIALTGVADSVSAVSSNATRWIYDGNPGLLGTAPTNHPKYLSFLTPIGGITSTGSTDAGSRSAEGGAEGGASGGGSSESTTYCGKAVFSDLHTSGTPSGTVPTSCPTTLTAQQKALEFLFFDLAACVATEEAPPPTPPTNPPPPPPPPQ